MQESLLPPDENEAQDAQGKAAHVMSVLVPYPVDKAYDYKVPEGLSVQAGDYVIVPLGNREIPAVVWGASANEVPSKNSNPSSINMIFPPCPRCSANFWTGSPIIR